MTVPTFTVLIGSAGRPSLRRSLQSLLLYQDPFPLRPDVPDQVIVSLDCLDSDEDFASKVRYVALAHDCRNLRVDFCKYDAGYHWYGVEQINYALRTVDITGTHILTIGDDDVYLPGCFDTLRKVCTEDPLRPVLFRFVAPWREVLWDRPRMQISRISGCCIAAPRQFVDPMPTDLIVEHDFHWMMRILERAKAEAGRDPLWLDYVGVIARPEPLNWPASPVVLAK